MQRVKLYDITNRGNIRYFTDSWSRWRISLWILWYLCHICIISLAIFRREVAQPGRWHREGYDCISELKLKLSITFAQSRWLLGMYTYGLTRWELVEAVANFKISFSKGVSQYQGHIRLRFIRICYSLFFGDEPKSWLNVYIHHGITVEQERVVH